MAERERRLGGRRTSRQNRGMGGEIAEIPDCREIAASVPASWSGTTSLRRLGGERSATLRRERRRGKRGQTHAVRTPTPTIVRTGLPRANRRLVVVKVLGPIWVKRALLTPLLGDGGQDGSVVRPMLLVRPGVGPSRRRVRAVRQNWRRLGVPARSCVVSGRASRTYPRRDWGPVRRHGGLPRRHQECSVRPLASCREVVVVVVVLAREPVHTRAAISRSSSGNANVLVELASALPPEEKEPQPYEEASDDQADDDKRSSDGTRIREERVRRRVGAIEGLSGGRFRGGRSGFCDDGGDDGGDDYDLTCRVGRGILRGACARQCRRSISTGGRQGEAKKIRLEETNVITVVEPRVIVSVATVRDDELVRAVEPEDVAAAAVLDAELDAGSELDTGRELDEERSRLKAEELERLEEARRAVEEEEEAGRLEDVAVADDVGSAVLLLLGSVLFASGVVEELDTAIEEEEEDDGVMEGLVEEEEGGVEPADDAEDASELAAGRLVALEPAELELIPTLDERTAEEEEVGRSAESDADWTLDAELDEAGQSTTRPRREFIESAHVPPTSKPARSGSPVIARDEERAVDEDRTELEVEVEVEAKDEVGAAIEDCAVDVGSEADEEVTATEDAGEVEDGDGEEEEETERP